MWRFGGNKAWSILSKSDGMDEVDKELGQQASF
jgi:hypothetical protein